MIYPKLKLKNIYRNTKICTTLKGKIGETKMAVEQVDVEYISLHGYIRNTPSHTEVYAEYQLRVDRST